MAKKNGSTRETNRGLSSNTAAFQGLPDSCLPEEQAALPSAKLRVPLRVKAMRMAGKWLLDSIESSPGLGKRIPTETFVLLDSFARRSGNYIEIDRALAERFVVGWVHVIERLRPDLLWQVRPCSGAPVSGEEAIAEIVADIRAALGKRRGRPPKVDPLEAYEANLRHKRSRRRSSSGVSGSDYAYEMVAASLGVGKSKGNLADAIRKGKETATNISKAKAMLPAGAEIMFVLTDSHDGGKSGVLVALAPPLKKDVK